MNPPAGTPPSPAAGGIRAGCATDDTITCWGDQRQLLRVGGRARRAILRRPPAGTGHSCALRTNGTVTCWGNNEWGQATAPDGQYSAVTAGHDHSCGLRTNGTITCWGINTAGRTDRARRPILRRHRRRGAFVRAAHQRHPHLLGHQPLRADRNSRRAVLRGHRRLRPLLRAAHRQHHHLLGQQRRRAGERARRAILRRHRRREPFVRTADQRHPHLLGMETSSGRRTRPTGNTPPSPPAGPIRAGCAPTAPSPAGANNEWGQATAPAG